MLAGDQAALAVAGVAVGVVGRLAEHRDGAGLLVPPQDAVVGDVAPEQAALVAEIDRPLGPAAAIGEAFDGGQGDAVLGEARMKNFHTLVRVAPARLPHDRSLRYGCSDRGASPRPLEAAHAQHPARRARGSGRVERVVRAAYTVYVERIGAPPGPMLDDYTARLREGAVWVVEAGVAIAALVVLLAQGGPPAARQYRGGAGASGPGARPAAHGVRRSRGTGAGPARASPLHPPAHAREHRAVCPHPAGPRSGDTGRTASTACSSANRHELRRGGDRRRAAPGSGPRPPCGRPG